MANLTCSLNNYGYNENTYLIIASDNGGGYILSFTLMHTSLFVLFYALIIISHAVILLSFFLSSHFALFSFIILGDPTTGVGSSHPFKGYKNLAWNGGVAATAIIHRYVDS